MLKKRIAVGLEIVFLLCVTTLIVKDFFPDLLQQISFNIPLMGMILLIITIILLKPKEISAKRDFYGYLVYVVYFIILITVLTLLGGKSSAGITFKDPFFFFVCFIGLLGLYTRWKKMKKD